jgi:uncharacterized phage-associated protein
MALPGYNARKAAQVIAYLASKTSNGRLNVVKAVKLVYLADRESMARHGFPILDEDRVSMPLGPVNSTTYSLINGEEEDGDWSKFLRDRANHELSVKPAAKDCNWDELSDADIAVLDKIWKKFGRMSQWELVKWTHDPNNIPEWEDPNGSSSIIPLSRIFKVMRIDNAAEQAALVDAHRRLKWKFDKLRE